MTPQELKNSILQRAIQGKLVEQRSEEGTAEELFQQIQAEKQALITAGKIKKEKPLPEIAEDEKPFDIPESWKWVRITELGSFIAGYTPKADELSDVGTVPYFKVSDMNTAGNEIFLHISNSFLKDSNSKKIYLKNTIVYPKNGGAVFTNKKRILLQDSVVDLNTGGFTVVGPVDLMYYYTFFSMIDFKQCYKGTALPTIDMDKLRGKWFPLPPLAEQKRIVAKIEELLPLIDRYEAAWSRLEEFNKRFPGDMQKSLLQMAIQGKLVEQRPEEGTGEELFRQIQAEKQALIKAGKIKKEKPLPEISEDEKPFDIPESWRWVRLSEICNVSDGTHQTPKYVEHGMPFISAQNVKPYKFMPEIHRDVSFEDYQEYNKQVSPRKGDILMTRVGAGIGEAAIIDQEFDFSIYVSLTLIKCYLSQYDMAYILNVLNSPLGNALAKKKTLGKGASQGNLNLCFIRGFVFPLPPLAEQKRIVAKLEELLPLCERLK